LAFEHTGNPGFLSAAGVGEIPAAVVGLPTIDTTNKEIIRTKLERHFRLKQEDGVVFIDPTGNIGDDLLNLRNRHEFAMDLIPSKIFLSHKGLDKPIVREYHRTLKLLGFEPWLDEDAMVAGVELERGLLQGFKDSCAAVFFVTPNFHDREFLATEVNYAMAEKRAKGDRFAIITLAFSAKGKKGEVPDLLKTYVYKEPSSPLDALCEIIRALPLTLGNVRFKTS
jgi:hypothetical protein